MQEGSVSLFFGSYGLLFYFYGSGFRLARFPGSSSLFVFSGLPACPFSRASGLLAFSGFRLARFLWFPVCPFFLVSGLPVFPGSRFVRFPGFPVCSFFRVPGLLVFSGFRLARFFWFPVCLFSRSFQPFLGLFGLFSVLYRGFFRFFVLYLQGGCSVLSVRKEIHKSSARIASC